MMPSIQWRNHLHTVHICAARARWVKKVCAPTAHACTFSVRHDKKISGSSLLFWAPFVERKTVAVIRHHVSVWKVSSIFLDSNWSGSQTDKMHTFRKQILGGNFIRSQTSERRKKMGICWHAAMVNAKIVIFDKHGKMENLAGHNVFLTET